MSDNIYTLDTNPISTYQCPTLTLTLIASVIYFPFKLLSNDKQRRWEDIFWSVSAKQMMLWYGAVNKSNDSK